MSAETPETLVAAATRRSAELDAIEQRMAADRERLWDGMRAADRAMLREVASRAADRRLEAEGLGSRMGLLEQWPITADLHVERLELAMIDALLDTLVEGVDVPPFDADASREAEMQQDSGLFDAE